VAVIALLLAAVAACGGGSGPTSNAKATAPAVTSRHIAAFGSQVPGTQAALQELQDAKDAGFDELVNYSSMNATPADITRYLDEAAELKVGIIYSTKDVLGNEDTDEANKGLHRSLFGETTDAQVEAVTKQFVTNPAVTRVFISDELPGNRDDLDEWLPHLKKRYDQIHRLAPGKPVMVVLYWSGDDPEFYGAVKKYADDFAIDFYPFPKNTQYGLESEIPAVGTTLKKVAGDSGWFVVQAFGWGAAAHPEGADLGYTKARYDPPNADQMVAMAEAAVKGGAKNLVFYSLADPNRSSLAQVKEAVTRIRQAPWWQS
jgi:hypothetical protein